jgi:XTP/dITP diphosphohydrolase
VTAGPPAQPAVPGSALLRLVEVMDTLRVSCPWDRKQTHESLAPYLLEECYEVLDALEGGEPAALRDELGDLLLQVVFQARIAADRADGTGFTIDDVAEGIVAKLVRRHPHVFGDVTVSGADEVISNWDTIKAAERAAAGGEPGSALDSVPFGQPALSLAAQLQRRAEGAGAPAGLAALQPERAAPQSEPAALQAERAVLQAEPAAPQPGPAGPQPGPAGPPAPAGTAEQPVSELGAELFALVARARAAGLDPELELRAAARAYRDRVRAWEHATRG